MLNFAGQTLLSRTGHFHLQAGFHCNSKNGHGPVILTLRSGFGLCAVHCPSLFYTNNNNLYMNDNKLLLVKTAVDPQYRLSAFYLKNNIKEQLKFNVQKHISFKADQKSDFSILPPEKQNLISPPQLEKIRIF